MELEIPTLEPFVDVGLAVVRACRSLLKGNKKRKTTENVLKRAFFL